MSPHSEATHAHTEAAPALLANLNPEQLAAVTLPARPALILAGAGSGKTRVLTTRIAWLIHTGQLSPGGVMAVTFTNKAAKEMRERVEQLVGTEARNLYATLVGRISGFTATAYLVEGGKYDCCKSTTCKV